MVSNKNTHSLLVLPMVCDTNIWFEMHISSAFKFKGKIWFNNEIIEILYMTESPHILTILMIMVLNMSNI